MWVGPLQVTRIKVHFGQVGVRLPLIRVRQQGFLKQNSSRLRIAAIQLPFSLGDRTFSLQFVRVALALGRGRLLKLLQVGGATSSVAFAVVSASQDVIDRRQACRFYAF